MLFNIWKTCTVCSNIAPRLLGRAWEQSGSEADSVISVSGQHSVYPSVCLFIWLSNYPSRQTAPQELNVNNTAQCYSGPGGWSSVSGSVVSVAFHFIFLFSCSKGNIVDCGVGSSQCVWGHTFVLWIKCLGELKVKMGRKAQFLHVKDDRKCVTLSDHCKNAIKYTILYLLFAGICTELCSTLYIISVNGISVLRFSPKFKTSIKHYWSVGLPFSLRPQCIQNITQVGLWVTEAFIKIRSVWLEISSGEISTPCGLDSKYTANRNYQCIDSGILPGLSQFIKIMSFYLVKRT